MKLSLKIFETLEKVIGQISDHYTLCLATRSHMFCFASKLFYDKRGIQLHEYILDIYFKIQNCRSQNKALALTLFRLLHHYFHSSLR